MSARTTFEDMKRKIKAKGAKPGFRKTWYEENYKNANSLLPLICECGEIFEIQAGTLGTGGKKVCKVCKTSLHTKPNLLAYETLIEKIKAVKCKPDFSKRWYNTNYEGQYTEIPLICSCQKPFTRSYNAMLRNPLCESCKSKQLKQKNLETIKDKGAEVGFSEQWFNENYEGIYTLLPLVCGCGNAMELTYKTIHARKSLKCESCVSREKGNTADKRWIRLTEIAKKHDAILSMSEEFLKNNGIENTTRIDFICKCGSEETLSYKYILQTSPTCSKCKDKVRREKRKKNAIMRRESYLMGEEDYWV